MPPEFTNTGFNNIGFEPTFSPGDLSSNFISPKTACLVTKGVVMGAGAAMMATQSNPAVQMAGMGVEAIGTNIDCHKASQPGSFWDDVCNIF